MPVPSMEQDPAQEEGLGKIPDPRHFHLFLFTMSELNISRDFREERKLEPEDVPTEQAVVHGNRQARVFVLNTGN